MSRTLLAAMTGHLATTSHTRCTMLLLTLRDGTKVGITDHNKSIDFDLGDGETSYDAGTGILPSDVAQSCGLEADNFEVRGPLNDTFTKAAILGGLFDRARAQLFQVNWKSLTAGYIPIQAGN